MRRRTGRLAGLALAAVLLAGCASAPRVPPAGGGEVLSGRIAVRVEALSPEEPVRSSSAAFELLGDASAGELRLSTPLGSVLAVARWQGDRATLQSGGETRHFETLQSLGREMLGEDVPVAALFSWLRGRAWDGAPAQILAGEAGFDQLGWRVSLARLAEGLVVATRLAAPAVTVRARVDR